MEHLAQMCREGKGDRYVLVSDDEEGNGFHECYCIPVLAEQVIDDDCGVQYPYDLALSDCVCLG